jgi:ectoine hydroxylase-related dioxygenase (phytanoyl-CoA dioxygenase family)
MNSTLAKNGFAIRRDVLSEEQIKILKDEANVVAKRCGSSCVRHLRERSKIFFDFALSETIYSLISKDLRPVRSILFDKTVDENWPVAWHQDLTIAVREKVEVEGYGPWSLKEGVPHVQPPLTLLQNMVTLRFHLDEADAGNGALQVIPESHRWGRVSLSELTPAEKSKMVVVECFAGDVVLMSPLLLHSSKRSEAPVSRKIIHIEYAREKELAANLQWFESV